MINPISCVRAPLTWRILAFCTVTAIATPALADHMGPSGVGGGGFAVISPWTLDQGKGGFGFRLVYTKPRQRSDALLEALAAQHIHAHNTDYNLNASLGAAYGISHRLTLSVELPYVRRDDLREGEHADEGGEAINEVARLGSVSGLGDLSLLAKYRLTSATTSGLALIAGIKAPTGSTHKHSTDGERLETEHQPGTGSWDPIVGGAAGTKAGALSFSASALYQFSGRGAQHSRLGDRLQGGISLSHRFGEAPHEHQESHNHHHGDELDEHAEPPHHSTWDAFVELGGEWEGRQQVGGEVEQASGGKWIYAAPGVRFTSANSWSVGGALAVPLWQDIRASHPDNRYRFMLSVGRAF
ncbi:transporter [Sphingomonas sp. URHD0057]|uniref:transporter n=1 Tax=Sphingomonas sp. URHD0057 TaxID=1380389 RepID=UPI00048E0B2D|nr:transporter [Sphingomonas sp. URHD0057]